MVYELDALGQWTGRTLELDALDKRPLGWIEPAQSPPAAGVGEIAAWSGSGWLILQAATPPAPPLLVPPVISDRQFFQQLALMDPPVITQQEALDAVRTGAIPAQLQAFIDTLPQPLKFAAEMSVSGSVAFHRDHPHVAMLAAGMGWTDEQVDDLWRQAAAL
jgi:hypothetical protein